VSHHVKGLFLIWPPGIGKMHPAFGIDLKAIDAVHVVCFSTALTLIEALEPAELKYELKKNQSNIEVPWID
jgi:DNA replication protein DnaC